jgi:hypothetical protein
MSGRHRPREPRRDSESDTDGDDDLAHIQCWIPARDIDLQALAAYLKEYVDDTANIRPSNNPSDPNKQGYTITARKTLNVAQVRDIIDDSRGWERERAGREYRRDPYGYYESDVWEERKRKGATVSEGTARRRRRAAASPPPQAIAQSASRHEGGGNETGDGRAASPILPSTGATTAQRQAPSIAAVTQPRHNNTDKERAQFTYQAMQPASSNMAKQVAKDRHSAA